MKETQKRSRSGGKENTENGKKRQTIKGRLLKKTLSIISIYLISLGGISSYLNYQSTVDSLKQTMTETVSVAADSITNELETYKALVNELTYNPRFRQPVTREELTAVCAVMAARNGVESVDATDAEGNSLTQDISVKEQEYFKEPQRTGEAYISDLIIRRDNGEMNIIVSAPITENDTFQGIVYMGLDATFLCELVSGISIGETGNASMINGVGDTIGYKDVQLVLDQYNTQDELKNDSGLAQLAAVERKVMAGETGFDSYRYGGASKYAAYSPIEGTNGWGLYVAVEKSEFLGSTYLSILVVIALIIIAILSMFFIVAGLARAIVNPILMCVERMKTLAEGDIHTEFPEINTGDETQDLAESAKTLIFNLKQVIGDIDFCLSGMSQGNFAIKTQAEASYVGDFENILSSMRSLNRTLSDTLNQIVEMSGQVAQGADQMSQNAQSLAEGATDQAGSVEELTATITNVANAAVTSAENSLKAYENAKKSAEAAEGSTEEIKKLTEAMGRITDTSKEIENIIGEIEEIASQTNLLSLNASIEAARAGEAGRGFAVVAGQIGKLAADSAQSAVNTRELIGKSLSEIEAGNEITFKTADALNEVISSMEEFAQAAHRSSEESNEQAVSMREVEKGVEQISSVVQSNSASAEEASATSEELFAQSENLNALVGRFTLRKKD